MPLPRSAPRALAAILLCLGLAVGCTQEPSTSTEGGDQPPAQNEDGVEPSPSPDAGDTQDGEDLDS